MLQVGARRRRLTRRAFYSGPDDVAKYIRAEGRRQKEMYTGGGTDVTWLEEAIFAGGGEHMPAAWEDFAAQTGVSGVVHLRPASPAAFASCAWLSSSRSR